MKSIRVPTRRNGGGGGILRTITSFETPPPVICGPVAIIPVQKGFFALVDVEDAELASGYNWRLEIREGGNQYAYSRAKRGEGAI
jgi:hypothetical protein